MGAVGSWPEAAAVFADLTSASAVVESTPNDLADEIELVEGDLGASGAGQAANVSRISFLRGHRYNAEVKPSSVSALTIEAGEIAIENAAGGIIMMKRNTSQITLDSGDIDVGGSFQASVEYNIFAKGDLTSTTYWGCFSTAATPSAVTYYKKIGHTKTDGSGNLLGAGNIKQSGFTFWTSLWKALTQGFAAANGSTTIFDFPTYNNNTYVINAQFSTSNSGDGANVNLICDDSLASNRQLSLFGITATRVIAYHRETPQYVADDGTRTNFGTDHHMRVIIR